jgi:hypothetical protein
MGVWDVWEKHNCRHRLLDIGNIVPYTSAMTRLHHNRNWKIEVFGREHGIPHFHLRWPDGRASITIDTLEVIIGNPPATIYA